MMGHGQPDPVLVPATTPRPETGRSIPTRRAARNGARQVEFGGQQAYQS